MIASNKFKYHNSEKGEDGTSNSFAFGNGDEVHIVLKLKEKKLIFTLKSD